MRPGSLVVVGTGIKFLAHLTEETRAHIEHADKVWFGVADPASASWIKQVNPKAEAFPTYLEGRPRRDTYDRWVELTLADVREGLQVCVVFYGHPGVFVYPSHEAVRRARREGFEAQMLPGISAEDCLFADLGVEPSQHGCQSFEATDFLVCRRTFDPTSTLILWQIGLIGRLDYDPDDSVVSGLRVLVEMLEAHYGANHEVVVYEAAQYPIFKPRTERVSLGRLAQTPVSALSTLYVPPQPPAPLDLAMVDRLGIPRSQVALRWGEALNATEIVSGQGNDDRDG